MRVSAVRTGFFSVLILCGSLVGAQAAPILTGATISFSGDFGGGPGSIAESDAVVAAAGPEITFLDGTGIGDNVLLDFESLDLDGLTITYTIQGGSNVDAVQAGYGDTGMVAGTFTFADLAFDVPTTILGFTTSLTDVLDPGNVAAGWALVGDTLTMTGLEQLLIAVGPTNTGRVTFTLQVEGGPSPTTTTTGTTTTTTTTGTTNGTTGSVPEPGVLSLLGGGLALLLRRRVRSVR